jgi:parvulin-like peptidyl-prolyl isomerase
MQGLDRFPDSVATRKEPAYNGVEMNRRHTRRQPDPPASGRPRSRSIGPVRHAAAIALLTLGLLATPTALRAEVVEEIVAWVNGEIITRSEYEDEEQARIAEAYRQFSGEELDLEVEKLREQLLLSLIDRKILVHHARALGYDLDRMGDAFLDQFMEQQGIESRQEVERLAKQDGMTLDQIKNRLVELYTPDEVIRFEVSNRISVSEDEIDTFYSDNAQNFLVEGEATLREIVLLADSAERKDERRAEAAECRRRAAAGEDFASLAKELSEAGTAANGGKLGPLKRADLAEALGNVTFTLPVGEISELMETPYGFHIIKVVSRIDEHTKPLDDVRERVRDHLQNRKFRTELDAFLEKARAESEWCVKPKHAELLSVPPPPPCERL